MPKRNPKISLGSVSKEDLGKVQEELRDLDWRNFGTSYLEDYEKGRDIRSKAFGYFNALGYEYGYALAKAYLDGFLSAEDHESAVEEARIAADLLESHAGEASRRAPLIDVEYARQAIAEVGDRFLPIEDPQKLLEFASTSQDGLYLKDFSYSVADALQTVRNKLRDFILWSREPYPVSYDTEQGYVPGIFQEPTKDDLKRAVKLANDQIRKRTYYGYYSVKLPDHPNLSILTWSNGSESWHLMWGPTHGAMRMVAMRGGGQISLDANDILVTVHPSVMEKVLPELDPLPLHNYSIEAKVRGDYPEADDRTVRKVLRAIIDAEMPGEDPEERAVAAIDLWDIFVKAKAGNPMAQTAVVTFFSGLNNPVIAYTKVLEDWMSQ